MARLVPSIVFPIRRHGRRQVDTPNANAVVLRRKASFVRPYASKKFASSNPSNVEIYCCIHFWKILN